ncbi:DMT family protein [Acuticoccus yangtzensis]|uniref:DMT family protein n=1 Tax=Acuticoccus yangtzensis TaxID=1443441 RepID=UPI00094962C9|nr:DMT family protein [Acuticoccus yangtzensis]
MSVIPVPVATIGLLIASNVFMTFAWYGHLKFKTASLLIAILASWGIAFFEYLLQVPANRIGYGYFNAAQLKTIQEVITLSVFMIFSAFYLGEPVKWNHAVGFTLIAGGAWFVFQDFSGR